MRRYLGRGELEDYYTWYLAAGLDRSCVQDTEDEGPRLCKH